MYPQGGARCGARYVACQKNTDAEDLCAAPAEQDAAQRSTEDLSPARLCAKPRCSAGSSLQSWMWHSALRKTLVPPEAAPRPDALQLHCCRAGCGTAL
ncbi:hypothetical protein PCASD_24881 [Puccinia coronata f. sp. avenae]|uniref:Uncharacterized protein n=1 Tax=Puccinia coronata f. sp. avenae TaxID=200324 RepID=A0A2N5TWA1_9BASI|nr:hypothetical protein PCASD_24881 [Puccinia coronata f. sp. avenae]